MPSERCAQTGQPFCSLIDSSSVSPQSRQFNGPPICKGNWSALRVVCCREIRRICPAKTCWAFFLVMFLPPPKKCRTGGDFTDTNEIDHAKRKCPVAVAYNVDLRTLQYRIEPQRLQHETNHLKSGSYAKEPLPESRHFSVLLAARCKVNL